MVRKFSIGLGQFKGGGKSTASRRCHAEAAMAIVQSKGMHHWPPWR